ncbi:MAG: prepilin-type N-terminal cleavage/methylation domain-containing protein [bacterium]|nr:prepilin-type N-terminal cleavage/methylation domain-containing protein [bacterium]
MKKLLEKAFTLVELLIVIGIIGILAVILLVTLNPAEAQRKARDAKRIKDAGTLQVIMEQAVADNLINGSIAAGTAGTITGPTGVNSGAKVSARKTQDVCTSANWLGFDICAYAKSTPMDPLNGYEATLVNLTTAGTPEYPIYRVRVVGIDYEINVRQESTGNVTRLTGDGGDADKWFEIASGPFTYLDNTKGY